MVNRLHTACTQLAALLAPSTRLRLWSRFDFFLFRFAETQRWSHTKRKVSVLIGIWTHRVEFTWSCVKGINRRVKHRSWSSVEHSDLLNVSIHLCQDRSIRPAPSSSSSSLSNMLSSRTSSCREQITRSSWQWPSAETLKCVCKACICKLCNVLCAIYEKLSLTE